MKNYQNIFGLLLCVILADGCGGTLGGNPEAQSPSPVGSTSSNALSFKITDAPVADARNVYVTVDSVSVLKPDGGWLTIPLQTATEIDLLHYQGGLSAPLATITTMDPGTYAQTRLTLSARQTAHLVDAAGTDHPLTVPSGTESGLKINTPFVIEAGVPKTIVIDFDLRKSIKTTGNGKYMLKPVLRMIEQQLSGSIKATSVISDTLCVYTDTVDFDAADSCDNATASMTASDTTPLISYLAEATYKLRVFRAGSVYKDIQAIKVKANETTVLDPY